MRYLLSILIVISFTCFGQTPVHKQYTLADGLPSMECYDVVQDSDGYMWIGTDKGLVKFDGKTFTTYTTANGLPSDVIYKFYPDDDGRIWCSAKDFSVFYIDKQQFYNYKYNSIIHDSCGVSTIDLVLHFDSKTQIFYGAAKSFYFSIDNKGNFSWLQENQRKQLKKRVITIHEHKSHLLAAGSYLHNDTLPTYISYQSDDDFAEWKTEPDNYSSLKQTISTNASTYTVSGSNILQVNKDTCIIHAFRHKPIYITAPNDHQIWVGTILGGAVLMTPNGKQLKRYLSGDSVSSIHVDRHGNIWMTTLNRGLFLIPKNPLERIGPSFPSGITQLDRINEQTYSLTMNGTLSALTKGTIIQQVTPSTVNSSYFTSFHSGPQSGIQRTYYGMLLNKTAQPPYTYSPQTIWINSENYLNRSDRTIYLFNKENRLIKTVNTSPDYMNDMLLVGDQLFIASSNGIKRCNSMSLDVQPLNIPQFDKVNILAFQRSLNSTFVLAKKKGIYVINDLNNPFPKHVLSATDIISMSIYKDQLWAIGKDKLYYIDLSDPQHKVHIIPTFIQSLKHISVNQNYVYLADNNQHYSLKLDELHFSDQNSVIFHPIGIQSNLNNFHWQNQLELGYQETQLKFYFDVMCYEALGENETRYKLSGSDTWSYLKYDFIELSNLQSGDYELVIESSDAVRNWHEVAHIHFSIGIPFWKTIWFFIVIGLSIIGITILIARNIIRRKALLAKTAALELSVVTQQINPHFIFNSLNSIRGLIFSNELSRADDYLVHFSKLTRKILNISRESSTTIENEIDVLQDYLKLEKMRSGEQFDFSIEVGGTEEQLMSIPSLLTQPFVENSVIHGVLKLTDRRGKISVRFITQEKGLLIEIEDNGVGRGNSNVSIGHKSVGMDLVKERLSIYDPNSSIKIEDLKNAQNEPLGTKITIVLTK